MPWRRLEWPYEQELGGLEVVCTMLDIKELQPVVEPTTRSTDQ
jgi:hypothetical protein